MIRCLTIVDMCKFSFLLTFVVVHVFYPMINGQVEKNNNIQQVPLFQWAPTETLKRINTVGPYNQRYKRASNFKFKLSQKISQKNLNVDHAKLGLDILIVTDYSIYKHFYESTNGNDYATVNAIYQYYTSILHEAFQDAPWMVNALGGPNVTDENIKSVDAFEALTHFRQWIKENAENLPEHDHAIAVTRYVLDTDKDHLWIRNLHTFFRLDLVRFGDSNAQGIAYVRTICKTGESTSVVEDVGVMATVAIAGHELAHSLGAEHDGQNNTNGCSTSHNYLMVPAVSTTKDTLPNTFTFSECTIKQIKKHIFSSGHNAQCLHHSPMENVGYSGLKDSNSNPGQIFDINKQCQHSFGLQFRFCSGSGGDDYFLKQMCRQIWCRNMTAGRKSRCYNKPYLPALTGTSCGNQMWCINGACVEDEKAPNVEGCKFGDRDTNFCWKIITNEPNKCKQPVFSRFCCESCRSYKRKIYRTLRI